MITFFNKIQSIRTQYFYDWYSIVKASVKHKAGNIITGIFKIIDGIILILTLGNISSDLTLKWCIYRRRTKTLTDNNE